MTTESSNSKEPTATQRKIIERIAKMVDRAIWYEGMSGRQSGKTTLRQMLAQRILDDDK